MNAAEYFTWVDLASGSFQVEFLKIGSWRTRILQAGSGPPLLLLHGTGGHLEAYARNIQALAERYHVIAYDYPGHGYSTHSVRPLEIDDYIDHLLGLYEGLGLGEAYLAGESLGGWIGARFALRHPDKVQRLVLNTPGGTMADPAVMGRIRELSQAAADDPTGDRIRARLEWLMADPTSVTNELVAIRKAIYSRPGFSESMASILCLQEPDVRARNMLTDEELSGITVPTMVVWTSDDPSGPAAAGLRMAELIPDAEFKLIDEAGHWPQWEQPESFNALVMEFLDG